MPKLPNISARDFATILGINPYQTAYELLEYKVEKKHPFFGNRFTENGNRYEKYAIEAFESKYNLKVESEQSNIKHEDYDWITGRLDGVFMDTIIDTSVDGKKRKRNDISVMEVKCPMKNDREDELTMATIPLHYWSQIQVYMNLIDCEYGYYVEYYIKPNDDKSNAKMYVLKVKRDRKWWNLSLPKIKLFYEEMRKYYELGNLEIHPVRMMENKWKMKFLK